jgi:vacuolar-type H+-ATPase subunit B/Vma2
VSPANTFALVARSFGELNRSLQGIAEEIAETSKKSVGRAIEIQAQLAKKAYETYISEPLKLGKMFLSGYSMLVRTQRTAAHRVSTKRKTGKVGNQSWLKRAQAK